MAFLGRCLYDVTLSKQKWSQFSSVSVYLGSHPGVQAGRERVKLADVEQHPPNGHRLLCDR